MFSMIRGWLSALLLASVALAAGPFPGQIKNLVTFGDSYTDVVSRTSAPHEQTAGLTTALRPLPQRRAHTPTAA